MKTYLVELLFKKILKLPTVIVDITNYTETGYSGQDLNEILTRLLNAADMDVEKAETGIVCLDEFDKIANSGGKNYVTDAGNNYLKGLGVQRELLKMVEGTNVRVQTETSARGEKVDINTTGIPFIACGAFSGLKSIVRGGMSNTVGFLQSTYEPKEKIANSYSEDDVNSVTSLQQYGFLPEIIGRFSRIVPFNALGEDELRSILQQNIVPNWNSEMILHEIDMVVDDSLIEYIVASALRRETGARSVESVESQLLEDAAYDAYSSQNTKRLILNLSNGKPGYRIEQYKTLIQSKPRSPIKKLEEFY